MAYNSDVGFTTQQVADRLGVSAKHVRFLAKKMKIRPAWVGPTMTFTAAQFQKMRDRNTQPGPKPKGRK